MSDLKDLPFGSRLLFLTPTNQKHVAAYLSLQQARGSAPGSLEIIVTAIQSLFRLLPKRPHQRLSQDITRVTPNDIDAWLGAAHKKGYAPSTRYNNLKALKRFFDFLIEQGELSE